MYASVWNRVALLATGMAFGWNLVHYWSADAVRLGRYKARVLVAAGLGLVVLVFLVASVPEALVPGFFVFAVCALVAYAGNAKQVSRVVAYQPFDQPERGLQRDKRIAVLLAHPGEPARYDGPLPWAERLQRLKAQGRPTPHWMMHPLMYGRIRRAYAAMGGENPLPGAISALGQALAERLGGGFHVRVAYTTTTPRLTRTLVQLCTEGFGQAVILYLGPEADLEGLRELVTRTRVREAGLRVTFAASHDPADWLPDTYGPRLQALMGGQPVEAPGAPPPELAADLRRSVVQAAKGAAPADEPM